MEREQLADEYSTMDQDHSSNGDKIIAPTINYINIENVSNLNTSSSTSSSSQQEESNSQPTTISNNPRSETLFQWIFKLLTYLNPFAARDPTQGLRQKLQCFYMESTLPCVAWLDRGQDLLINDYYTELQLDISDTIIPVEEIFNNVQRRKPLRILIEGQPGYGKTTLATKIVNDWSLSKDYIKHFKLTFFVPLRELRQRSIVSAISAIAAHCGFNNTNSLRDIIDENVADTLLILDGLDELAVNERMSILKLMYKQEYAEMTVIVTCRTGLFSLEYNEVKRLFGGISKKKEFYDKTIRVLGIGVEDRKNFLLKFSPQNSADDTINQIEQLTKPVAEMFKSPLFLILLAFMISKNNDLTKIASKTELFKKLFNFTIKHSMKNNPMFVDSEFDLFQLDSSINDLQIRIQQFGKLALEHILKNNIQFDCNQLTKQIYEMGFLINHKKISFFESSCHYEGFHFSILEFAAAFSIWFDFKQNTFNSSGSALDQIPLIYFKLDKSSLILPFLVGLLQDEANNLFQQLLPHAHIISASEELLCNLLTECEPNIISNKLLSSVNNFISPHIHQLTGSFSHFYKSDWYENLLKYGINIGIIKQIHINNVNPSNVPQNTIIPCLWVDIFSKMTFKLEKMLQNVQCNRLVFRFNTGFRKLDDETTWNSLCLLSSLPREKCSLYINGYTVYDALYNHIDTDVVKQIQFNNLSVQLNQTIKTDLISILLNRNQILTLQIFISCISTEFNIDNIINASGKSTTLHSLEVIANLPNDMPIDLYQLTNGGRKNYKCLMLKNSPILCKSQLANTNCIHTVIIKETFEAFENKTFLSVEALSQINPSVLECDVSLFYKLPQTWTGYINLNELILSLDKPSSDVEFWRLLPNCKNLKMLELIFPAGARDHTFIPVNEIVKCLQQLKIERFVLWRIEAQYEMAEKLAKSIAESFPWSVYGTNSLTTIDLACLSTVEDMETEKIEMIISHLLDCLKLNYFKCLNVICRKRLSWYTLMRKYIIDHYVFHVKHSIHGASENEPNYYKTWYNAFSSFSYNTYCIQLKDDQL